jgi:hypothetical protein
MLALGPSLEGPFFLRIFRAKPSSGAPRALPLHVARNLTALTGIKLELSTVLPLHDLMVYGLALLNPSAKGRGFKRPGQTGG